MTIGQSIAAQLTMNSKVRAVRRVASDFEPFDFNPDMFYLNGLPAREGTDFEVGDQGVELKISLQTGDTIAVTYKENNMYVDHAFEVM